MPKLISPKDSFSEALGEMPQVPSTLSSNILTVSPPTTP